MCERDVSRRDWRYRYLRAEIPAPRCAVQAERHPYGIAGPERRRLAQADFGGVAAAAPAPGHEDGVRGCLSEAEIAVREPNQHCGAGSASPPGGSVDGSPQHHTRCASYAGHSRRGDGKRKLARLAPPERHRPARSRAADQRPSRSGIDQRDSAADRRPCSSREESYLQRTADANTCARADIDFATVR
jgi:hypothetical protein